MQSVIYGNRNIPGNCVMEFSDYLENKVVGHVFGGSAYTAPSTLYVALYTSAPSDTGGGTEVSGGAYARQTAAFTVTADTASNTSAIATIRANM